MTRIPRTTFSTGFKREAVQLLEHGGKKVAQLASKLGIGRTGRFFGV